MYVHLLVFVYNLSLPNNNEATDIERQGTSWYSEGWHSEELWYWQTSFRLRDVSKQLTGSYFIRILIVSFASWRVSDSPTHNERQGMGRTWVCFASLVL
jgi:hypothetical protein